MLLTFLLVGAIPRGLLIINVHRTAVVSMKVLMENNGISIMLRLFVLERSAVPARGSSICLALIIHIFCTLHEELEYV